MIIIIYVCVCVHNIFIIEIIKVFIKIFSKYYVSTQQRIHFCTVLLNIIVGSSCGPRKILLAFRGPDHSQKRLDTPDLDTGAYRSIRGDLFILIYLKM